MRLSILIAALVFVLAATPAMAQSDNGDGTNHIFGSASCTKPVPCPEDYDTSMTKEQITENANSCITQFFGYSSPSGFFDGTGLNSNNCLDAVPGVLPKGMGAQLAPRCCVVKKAEHSCNFRCDLITVR